MWIVVIREVGGVAPRWYAGPFPDEESARMYAKQQTDTGKFARVEELMPPK